VQVVEPLRVDVTVPGRQGGSVVEILSEASVAHDVLGNGDRRLLGVPLVGVTAGRHLLDPIRARASLANAEPVGTSWLGTYDLVLSNSRFTQGWVERWWGRASEVLEPPVGLREPAEKHPVILSVGRFFAPGRGHAKKQLELVEGFRRLCATGVDGWELHLVGGCSPDDRAYLEQVRSAAADLPVVFHVDASGAEVDELYRRASVYWHATGLGEDLDADPVRAEHFGITTVEAMSAGAVPVVIAAGGQTEIVRDGIEGFTFTDLDGLVGRLLADPALRADMALAATARAEQYGLEQFGERLRSFVAGVEGSGSVGR
jgi:glycosyltransferase involved in cell wall biosynthesis